MKKNIKVILLFIALFIYSFIVNFLAISNNDLIWNYGFCYNVSNGLKMYHDFNMVITPLYPTIFGFIMKILGNNMIIFYLSNAIIPTIIYMLVYKYYRKAFIETILLISFISIPNYNLLCMLLLFILFILEDKKKNDYLIGIVLGLIFLTKSSMGLLSLASLYYFKDIKKILKRVVGFMLPNIIYIIYFYINGTLLDYIDFAFGSLFDFANKNFILSLGIIVFIISIIYLIYRFYKDRNIKVLYILLFQIMSYPIFNLVHIVISLIPLIFYIVLNIKNKFYIKYSKFLCIFLICPLLSSILQSTFMDMHMGTNALKYKRVESKYYNDSVIIKNNISDLDNVYFLMYEGYYNKLLLGLDIKKYDMPLNGNLGYDGNKKLISYLDSLKMGTKIVMYNQYEGGQAPKEVYNYVVNNYKFKDSFDKYIVYVK